MADIFQTTFSNAFSWMNMYEFLFKFHWFVSKQPINNIPALVQIMAWRRSGDKPLSEPIMVRLQTHICVTRLQWVKWHSVHDNIKHVFLLKVLWWFWIFEQTLFNVIMRDIVANIIRFVWNHRCITHKILYNSSVGLKCTAIINRMTNAQRKGLFR